MNTLFAAEARPCGLRILPRDYQIEAVDSCYRLWDSGTLGALVRAFTGAGKTIMACMAADRWLSRGDDYRALILSYEIQLVDQFAQEIEDVLGIRPGIEQSSKRYSQERICVACRPTLLPKTLANDDQKASLARYGITDCGLLTLKLADTILRHLAKEKMDVGDAKAMIGEHNCHWTVHPRGIVSRVHQFDPTFNWLIVADEAHKFTYKHKSIQHLYDWFATNDRTRWLGITATPKRADGVSIGHKLFPGIALDFPLYSPVGRCAVKDGYAVPYKQKYICVEGVDFKSLAKVAGDFDENELGRVLGNEEQLARLVEPMLELSEERRGLIFNPTVQMAKDVAAYVNARVKCRCDCEHTKWYPSLLIGDGATCPQCGSAVEVPNIILSGDQCQVVWQDISPTRRKEIYRDHQKGKFQFLSVCGLCKEGYNDPDIACVAVFRPVSKAASSLAEQMKGRASRPLRGLIEGMAMPRERVEAIANSAKPDALIIDLVGITGLADCASTAMIYAEGLPDEVLEKAEQLLLDDENEIDNVEEAVKEAIRLTEEEKERIRKERLDAERRAKEEAEQRSRAGAEVTYSAHEVGSGNNSDPTRPSDKMLRFIAVLGMEFEGWEPSRKQASRIIGQLQEPDAKPEEVAYSNNIPEGCWKPAFISGKYLWWLRQNCGYRGHREITKHQANAIRAKYENPSKWYGDAVLVARSHQQLSELGAEIFALKTQGKISDGDYQVLVNRGKSRRDELNNVAQEF